MPPVKVIAGLISRGEREADRAVEALRDRVGPVSHESPAFPFEQTRYYEPEMGPDLTRRFLAFEGLHDPAGLPRLKRAANALERELSGTDGRRSVNVDPGYLAPGKLVLASTKDHAHRVYLSDGIYGEVTLQFRDGRFRPWTWTYPDYRTPDALAFFERVYAEYLAEVRTGR